jgi:hemerythrin-like domain-containing protein
MTSPMTMNRVIHGAVRRDLARSAAALDSLAVGDTARADDLARAFANLRRELTNHHESEDTHAWPALQELGADPGLLEAMETEHADMSQALADTDTALSTLARTGTAADAAAARQSLERTRQVVDRHLTHEETDLEPVIQKYAETPEWQAVEKAFRRHPPTVIGPFLAWLTDGMEDDERSYFRGAVPAPVVAVFTAVFGRRYTKQIAPVWRTA